MNWEFEANGKRHVVSEQRGDVVDVQVWSETRVSTQTSGGGGSIINGSGYISAPTVSVNSSVRERMRTFVRWDEGGEGAIQTDHSVPFRVGNRLSEIYVHKGKTTKRIQLKNLDTGRWLRSKGYYEKDLPGLTLKAALVLIVLGLGLSFATYPGDSSWWWYRLSSIVLHFGDYLENPGLLLGWLSLFSGVALPMLLWLIVLWLRRLHCRGVNKRVRAFWSALEAARPSVTPTKAADPV